MQEQKVMSFVLNSRIEELIREWAAEDDRTMSATLRQILEQEAQRRQAKKQQKPVSQPSH